MTRLTDTLVWILRLDAYKTVAFYERVLSRMVLDLWRGDMGEGEFIDRMVDLISDQLRRAWNEGMRANDLDPKRDMEPEWEEIRDDAILKEFDFVDGLAADIVAARGDEAKYAQIQARVGIWVNRYNEVVNLAIITTKEQKLKWIYGDTEHCGTCANLNGIVALSSEWDLAGVHPQRPPNEVLECGGWRCQCRLEPTKERKTPRAFDRIMQAIG